MTSNRRDPRAGFTYWPARPIGLTATNARDVERRLELVTAELVHTADALAAAESELAAAEARIAELTALLQCTSHGKAAAA